ncbi:MAG: DNAase [Paenibacillaceae bacterium ZCTH02-B3]|nr:MAG: DNAase [Paenibacillaceae bacterium ZCTH02-B3]
MIDAHIHLDMYEEEDWAELLGRAAEAGVRGVVGVSKDPSSCRVTEVLARKFPDRVLPAYGHHPEQEPLPEEELEALCDWIAGRGNANFAVGEVGLPYFAREEARKAGRPFDMGPHIRQLARFIRLARELGRPLALHAVHGDADLAMELLEREGYGPAHFHWYKGSPGTTARLARAGHYISITPEVLYDPASRELAAHYPLDRLLAETDGPWPYEGPYAGRRTEPAMAADVAAEVAALRGLDRNRVAETLAANARRYYGWPD